MRKIFVSVAILSVAFAAVDWKEVNEICGISNNDRIIGGTAASLGQFPWIAHIGILRRDGDNVTLRFDMKNSATFSPKKIN